MKLSVMICILVVVNINSLKGSVLQESRPKLHVKPSMRFEEDLTLVRMPLRKHEAVQGVRPSRTKAVSLKMKCLYYERTGRRVRVYLLQNGFVQ